MISYQDHVVSQHFLLLSHLELLYTSLHIFHAYIVVYVSISLAVNFRFMSDLDCRVHVCGKSPSYVSFVVSDCWQIWWYFLFDILYFKIFYPCFVSPGTSMGNSVQSVKFRASKTVYPTPPPPLSHPLTQSSLWELLINSISKYYICFLTYLFLISLFMLWKVLYA